MSARIESQHQMNLFCWANMVRNQYPELELMYAIPNGADVSGRHRIRLVREGLKSGMPDIHLPVSRHGYHSLYLELKTGTGRTSRNQERMMNLLEDHGNLCKVSRSLHESIRILEEYLA